MAAAAAGEIPEQRTYHCKALLLLASGFILFLVSVQWV